MAESFVEIKQDGPRTIVRLSLPPNPDVIELDQLARDLRQTLDTPGCQCIFDLSATGFAGSSVLGFLVNARGRLKRVGGRLVLCHLGGHLMESFKASSLATLFEVTPTVADAVALLG